ncbi:hypothetical protein H5410_002978 [Solanum commersonii]|uniref:Uncharacterized protein n=1 Tax=Solanum commersonii TaxID=4109 RepID=A0A9J6B3D3_SOLCO|nr:hypothetical protein H5410_002978 [Solanum commersonii]
MRERPATAQLNIFNASSTSSQQVRGKGSQPKPINMLNFAKTYAGLHDLPAKQPTEYPLFQRADGLPRHATDTPPMSSPVSLLQHESQLTAFTSQYCLVGTHSLSTTRSGGSKAIQQSGNRMQQPNTSSPPAQTLTPIKFTIETSNADECTCDKWKHTVESNSSPNYSLPTAAAAAANSAFTMSVNVIHSEVVNKSQGNEISFSSQASTESSLSQAKIMPSASSSQGPMLSTI